MSGEARPRTSRRRSRRWPRPGWIVAAGAVVVLGTALLAADGPPASRPEGAGLPPAPLPSPAAPFAGTAATPEDAERRAAIAAEEARLGALREARAAIERDIVALRAEQQRLGQDRTGRAAAPAAVPPDEAAPGQGLRVFVHHRADARQAAAGAAEIAQSLRAAGFEVPATRAVPYAPSTPVVRFFHDEDQAAAARLAGRLGRGWAVQDFRAYQPQPAPQTLEVWLAAN